MEQVYTPEYVLNRIKVERPVKIDLWSGFINDPVGQHPFLRIDGRGDPDNAIKQFAKFIEETPNGQFTVFSRIANRTAFKSSTKMYFSVVAAGSPEVMRYSTDTVNSTTAAQVEKLVNERIEKYEVQRRIEELEKQLTEAKNPWNNIKEIVIEASKNLDLENILMVLLTRRNTAQSNHKPMNGTNQVTQQQLTTALQTLVDLFGAEAIVGIAEHLKNNLHKVEMLKNFAS